MTLEGIKKKLSSSEYDFLRTNEHLGENIILLGLGGSYAYGCNTTNSDLDIRGISLNSKKEILLGNDFSQIEHKETDTLIRSFNRYIQLLEWNNPSVIELLGLKKEHYLYIHPIGQEIIDNKNLFLCKKAISAFKGYIFWQLKELKEEHNIEKIPKRMYHPVRLYHMIFDLIEIGDIITYRRKDHGLLMNIRNGEYLKEGRPNDEYKNMLKDYAKKLEEYKSKDCLPDKPNYEAIQEFVISVNERIVKGEI